MAKIMGKRIKVKTIDEMLSKLSDGLNLRKQVLVVSDDDGFTLVHLNYDLLNGMKCD